MPAAIGIVGAVLFVGGGLMILVLAAFDARRRGIAFGHALWQGVVQAVRWLLLLMP